MVADGATAASGGKQGGGDSEGGQRPTGKAAAPGCAGPTTPVRGQPSGYRPFVGPICSADGKAAIVTAYLKGDGESDSILDPIQDWRDKVSDPGGGLEVKITGGAGYAADAIEVFESINGTLLLAAVSLVIILLILIYRSPVFLFVPLLAVIFAEMLSRSVGYGLSEIGVTINGQSSSIMSVLVLGAGTDYALLIVSRYREELHHTSDRHVAIAEAMRSAGPAVFASAATVVAALLCLTLAKVNGTAGLGPIGAMGVACAALSMLTLLPALLTIFGRRALWPFVPHTPETAPDRGRDPERDRPAGWPRAPSRSRSAWSSWPGWSWPCSSPSCCCSGWSCSSWARSAGPTSGPCTTTCSCPTSCAATGTRSPGTPRTASGRASGRGSRPRRGGWPPARWSCCWS